MELKTRLQPDDEVVSYGAYYQDLPVYLERRITVVDWTGELYFGTTVEDTSEWMIGQSVFARRWKGPNTLYMMTSVEEYDTLRRNFTLPFHPVARNRNTVLLSNKEVKP